MKLNKLKKTLDTLYDGQVNVSENENSRVLTGTLDSWDDIVNAGRISVIKHSNKHVVNDIKLRGVDEVKMKTPKIVDLSLDGARPDVLIIGGGISGASILRELTKWDIRVLLIEKEADLAKATSSRNDGEVHPGVDLSKGSLKQRYVVRGNRMYDKISAELDVPFKRIGQYAGFTNIWLKPIIRLFCLERKFHSKVDDTKLVSSKKIKELNPHLNKDFKFAIYNPMAGITSPYELTIAYAENAVENGAQVSLNTCALEMHVENKNIISVKTNRGTIYPKLVINAAGMFSDKVAEMANDKFFSLHPRKGTIAIMDKKCNYLINTIASIKNFNASTNKVHTKGGGSMRTIHDNLLEGPDAIETYLREEYSTNVSSIKTIFNKQKDTLPSLSERDIITYFSGFRAATYEEDFIIERGRNTKNIYHVAGIQSPGITTAPAVAVDVSEDVINILKENNPNITINQNYNPIRKGTPRPLLMSMEERNALIKENPDYGVIVCRCEEVSKGEIIDCLNRPIKVPTIDAIKKRVRPGMGRCQGSFCMPVVAKIISEHENIPLDKVLKSGEGSEIGAYLKGDETHE